MFVCHTIISRRVFTFVEIYFNTKRLRTRNHLVYKHNLFSFFFLFTLASEEKFNFDESCRGFTSSFVDGWLLAWPASEEYEIMVDDETT